MSSPGGAPRVRRAWLLVPAAFLVSAGAGFPVGHALSAPDQPDPTPGPTASVVDACVVGTWETVSHTEAYSDSISGTGTLTGLDRRLEISADGVETVTFGDSPAAVAFPGQSAAQLTMRGSVVFDTTTDADEQTFSLVSSDVTYVLTTASGSQEFSYQPSTAAVRYECDGDTYRQFTDTGFESVLTRVDG